jgi:hypothetical protein
MRSPKLARSSVFLFVLIGLTAFVVVRWPTSQRAARRAASTQNILEAAAMPVAATVTVNTSTDVSDTNIGDGHCDTDGNLGNGDQCTLRAAIQETNANPTGPNSINFSLPVNTTISLNSVLPDISSNVMISGGNANTLTVQRSTVAGTPSFRIFTVASGVTVTIAGLTLTNGWALSPYPAYVLVPDFFGGAIYSERATVTINDCIIKGNQAFVGGGLANRGGVMNINRTTITNNVASAINGGNGGGVANGASDTPPAYPMMTIDSSTISNNTADEDGGGVSGANVITNSTISSNTAKFGGGILNGDVMTLENVTVAGNVATSTGGGIENWFADNGRALNFKNTIIAGNTAPAGPDCHGAQIISNDYNLIGNTAGITISGTTTYNITGVDPKLGPLQDNGGPTMTRALLVGSPAIDAGNTSQTTDQRGEPRSVDDPLVANAAGGNASDIGAYESDYLQVNTLIDANDGNCTPLATGNGCTLAEAITVAGFHSGRETITFAPALTALGPAIITLNNSLPDLFSDMDIVGPGSSLLTIERSHTAGTPDFTIFTSNSGRTVTISGLTIANGSGLGPGGVYNDGTMTLATCNIFACSSSQGSAAIQNLGTLTMNNCQIGGNSPGQPNSSPQPAPVVSNNAILIVNGGGIIGNAGTGLVNIGSLSLNGVSITDNHNNYSDGGILTFGTAVITNSLIANNSTVSQAGGLHNFGATVTVTNSTISGNSSDVGGGIYAEQAATTILRNVTITNNHALSRGGGIASDSNLVLQNSIVAGNFQGASASDLQANVSGNSFNNLIGIGGAGGLVNGINGNQVGVANVGLGPLANNGGPTITHALLLGSPAIDAGNNCVVNNSCSPALAAALTTDQRGIGFNRSADGNGDGTARVDVGAYEVQSILVTNTSDSGAGSLRQAIIDANANQDTNAIDFQSGLTGTIDLLTALPNLSTSISINGPGANMLTVRRSMAGGTPPFRLFTIAPNTAVNISGLAVTNGRTADGGPGVPGDDGGGILNSSGATLNLIGVAVTGNFTGAGGSGAPAGNRGGGVYNEGTLTLVDSTISTNKTGGGMTGGAGGGIFNGGTATLINSTISGNLTGDGAGAGGNGGGIANTGTLTLANCTISNNQTGNGALGGGVFNPSATVNIRNTIVANNTSSAGPDLSGTFVSQDYNLIGNTSGATTFTGATSHNVTNVSAMLGSLANNGGSTMTHALLPGSPAINGGNNGNLPADTFDLDGDSNIPEPLPIDQRGVGFNRIINTTVDIGAVEANYAISTTAGSGQSAQINSPFATQLKATVTESGNLKSGIPVTFMAPVSGASGSFPGFVTTVTVTTNGSGVATAPAFTANATAGGPYNVTASLGGSLSTTFSLTNLKANQTITFGPQMPRLYGDPDHAVQDATTSSGLPLTFTASDNCTMVSANLVHITGAGVCTITASQPGNDTYNAAVPVSQTYTITKSTQQTTVTSSPNPSDFGQPVTFTATVATPPGGYADAPTGTVQFKSDGIAINCSNPGGQTLNGSGAATCQISTLSAGTHIITANYSGSANYNASSGTLSGNQIVRVQPALSINDFSVTEGDSGTKTFSFTATLSAASNLTIAVAYATANGSTNPATGGNACGGGVDYVTTTGTLTFDPNQTQKTINVSVCGDQKFEPDESFFVNLTNPTNATISDHQGQGTILNDDAQGGIVSFSASEYTVFEADGLVIITVNRSGDTTAAATVDYATDDTGAPTSCADFNGFASAKCDFTTALGRLQFAANETQKTFSVLVNRDSYTSEVPFDAFSVKLLNLTGGAVFGANSTATVKIMDSGSPGPNAIDDSAFFVRQHYHDFLNREPDSAGLQFWTNEIESCGTDSACREVKRINVSGAFFLSIEFQQTGYLIERLYKTAYGDAVGNSTFPSAHTLPVPMVRFNEFLADTQEIGRGVIVGQGDWEQQLENNKVAFIAAFVQRPRFTTALGGTSNVQFVDTLNANAGSPLSQSERDQLVAGLNNSSKSRAQVLRAIAEHPNLVNAEFNRAFVLMQFFGYMRRNPDDPQDHDHTGYDFWLTKLNQFGGNFQNAEMVKAFISADEYRHRFGP